MIKKKNLISLHITMQTIYMVTAMSQKLPIGGFKWEYNENFNYKSRRNKKLLFRL